MGTQWTKAQNGFSLLEMIIVVAIIMVMVGLAVPNLVTTQDNVKIRRGMDETSGIFKLGRALAVKQNRVKRIRFTYSGGRLVAFVDDFEDPTDLTNTSKQLWLPSAFSYTLGAEPDSCPKLDSATLWGGGAATSSDMETNFSPQGIPCDGKSVPGVCTPGKSTVHYFQYSGGGTRWAAVGISSAGKIKTMFCTGGSTGGTWTE